MQWTDDAIILSVRKFGENKALVKLLAQNHGLYAAIARAPHSKNNRGLYAPGNKVSVTWQARLAEQMGSIKAELLQPYAALLMQDGMKLSALSSACSLLEAALPERHPYPQLYTSLVRFLSGVAEHPAWHEHYVRLELDILAESGFGLDLSCCAATGVSEGLIYVSPRSGRAVSESAGAPYKDKLLPLPAFLRKQRAMQTITLHDALLGLNLSGYFLDQHLAQPHGRKLPAARQRFVDMLK